MVMAATSSSVFPPSLFSPSSKTSSIHCNNIFIKLHKPYLLCCSSNKKTTFVDQILDYIEGGPKLRKWYGASDQMPRDGVDKDQKDDSPEVEEARDAVLVTDGNSEIGQMVILSLIVKRSRVKAIVQDRRAAIEAFGTYVESIAGDTSNSLFLRKALRGVRAIICPSNEGFLSNIGSLEGVEHIVLLSQLAAYRGNNGIKAPLKSNARKLAEQDELMVMASGIPYTIIQAGSLESTPGGKNGFNFEEGSASQGTLSKEDAAFICVEALDTVPQGGLVFEVSNGNENVSDWKQWFATLIQKTQPLQ